MEYSLIHIIYSTSILWIIGSQKHKFKGFLRLPHPQGERKNPA